MKDDEKFDDLIRQKTANHEAPVPADAWDNIIQKKKKRRGVFFWWWLTGFLLIGGAGYFVATIKMQPTKYAATETRQEPNKTIEHVEKDIKIDAANDSAAEKLVNARPTEKDTAHTTKYFVHNSINSNVDTAHFTTEQILNKKLSQGKETIAIADEPKKSGKIKVEIKTVNHTVKKRNIVESSATKKKRNFDTTNSNEKIVHADNSAKKEYARHIDSFGNTDVVFAQKGHTQNRKMASRVNVGIFSESMLETNSLKEDSIYANDSKISKKEKLNLDSISLLATNPTAVPNRQLQATKVDTSNGDVIKYSTVESEKKSVQIKKEAKRENIISDNGKWWVDISAIPVASISKSRTIPLMERTTQMPNYIAEYKPNKINISQDPAVVYAIAVRRRVSKKWALGIGFQYQEVKEKLSLSGTETHTSTTVVQRLQQTSNGPILINDTIANVTIGTRTIEALNSYKFISLPVFAQYHFNSKNNWMMDWSIGTFINVSRKYSNSVDGSFIAQGSTINVPDNSSSIGFDLYSEFRVSKRLAKKIYVFAGPNFRYNLTEYKMHGMFNNKYLHQAGITVGLSFKLK